MVGGTPKFLFFFASRKKIQCLYHVWTDRWRSWAQTAKKQICLLGKLKVASLFPTGDTNSLWFCDRKYKTLPNQALVAREQSKGAFTFYFIPMPGLCTNISDVELVKLHRLLQEIYVLTNDVMGNPS